MSTLLQVNNLEISYGSQPVLSGASFNIGEKQKVALFGRNGAGKSTLFKLIIGEEQPSSGEIKIHTGTHLGYLTQHNPFEPDQTVIDFLMKYSDKPDWFCAKIAGQFQLKGEMLTRKIDSFSGGYQMRVKLSAMLAKEPNLLLLDEPTNYLDLSTQLLLEQFLSKYNGAFMLISHDREFIKRTCNQTLELENGKTILFPQPLDEYLDFKFQNRATIEKTNQKILEEKARLQAFIDKNRVRTSTAAMAQSRIKQMSKLKLIEIAHPLSTSRIKIPSLENKKGLALEIKDTSIGYPEKIVANNINFYIERGEKIAVVGDNGQGKTTLLKTIANELKPLSGEFKWGSSIQIGYYAQHTPSTIQTDLSVETFLRQSAPPDTSNQQIMEMAGNFLFTNDNLKKPISILSGGEKARLCLANILLQKNQVLLLDEPTNHLDFETVEALATALRQTNITVIFVSHNRTFVETLATGIIEVNNGKVSRYNHNYEEYVYHIKSKIEEDLISDKKQILDNTNSENQKKHENQDHHEKRKHLKRLNNSLRKIEENIDAESKNKQILLEWFEVNPYDYTSEISQNKSKELGNIDQKLQELETQWLEISTEIETLSEELNK